MAKLIQSFVRVESKNNNYLGNTIKVFTIRQTKLGLTSFKALAVNLTKIHKLL